MPKATANRDLLFGILALQMDFISKGALISARREWDKDKSKSVRQILLEQNALAADTCGLLEALVQQHLVLHGNDAEKSLAALARTSSTWAELQQIADLELDGSLAHLSHADDPVATVGYVSGADAVGTRTSAGLRFRILRPHAKGGLGQVHVARDEELQREVALKEIQARHADNRESRARFLLEAEITGGLEHPGIVPVYGLGQHADGRPFYVMRFIKGDSLQSAIKEFHQAEIGARDAGQRILQLRKLLGRLIDVCEAIQYAHDRGVLHRDLKPGNIMLGKYGETLVVDWGIAKPMAARDEQRAVANGTDEPTLRPVSADNSAETLAGTAMGTPQYMSPEQAAGRLDQLGAASDVYSLGATLYCLLTGKAPVQDTDTTEVLRKVQSGDFPRPRQLNADADPVLEAICLKAMALKPADRYASPRALADDIEHWLADEPVSAHAEPFAVRARRWMRQHRTFVTSAAAVLLVATISSLAGAALLANLNGQMERRNQALDTANQQLDLANANLKTINDKLDLARKDADSKRKQAEDAQQIAQAVRNFLQLDLLHQADPLDQANRLLALSDKRFSTIENPTIKELLDRAAVELTPDKIEQKFPGQPLVQAEILQTVGRTYVGVGEFAKGVAHLKRARSLYEAQFGPDHADTLSIMNNLAQGYHAAGQWELALPLFEKTLKARKVSLGADHVDTLASMHNLASCYESAGKRDLSLPLFEQTLKLMKVKFGPNHSSTFASINNLAGAYQARGKLDLALPYFEETLKLMQAKLGPDHPQTLTSMNNLADAYRVARKLPVALPLYEQTLKLRQAKLGLDHPQTLNSMNNLALGYQDAEKLELALPLLLDTLKLRKAKLGPDHRGTLGSMNNLAGAYRVAGKLNLAEPLYEETLKLMKVKLGRDHPDTLTTMNNLGVVYHQAGKPNLAEPLYEETLKLMKVKLGPDHPETLTCMYNLALCYRAVGKLNLTVPLLEETVRLRKIRLGPNHPETIASMSSLAENYQAAGKPERALPVLDEKFTLMKAQFGPDDDRTLTSMNNLAAGYYAAGKLDLAVPLLEETLKRRRAKFGEGHPMTLNCMNNLAVVYQSAGKLELALPLFEETLKLMKVKPGPEHPDTIESINRLAKSYLDARQPEKALPHLADLVAAQRKRLGPNDSRFADLLTAISLHLLKARQFPEAEKLLRECLAIRAKHEPDAWTRFAAESMLGSALLGQKQYQGAEPLLLAGYEGMKEREAKIPTAHKLRLSEAEGRLAELFEVTRTKTETKLQGKLLGAQSEMVHEVKLTAGKPAIIELRSRQPGTRLRLQDAKGKTLAENNLNARILFMPKEDGVYRIISASEQQAGRTASGEYEIIIREYGPAKSKQSEPRP